MILSCLFAIAMGSEDGVFPYQIERERLENGLTVIAVPMQTPGVVSYYTWMSVGSRDEVDVGRTGFAHFFEHLMFYGTETLGGAERERAIARMGAEENAWTWFDDTVYHATLSTTELPALVAMEADRFQNLALTASDVEREAGAVYGEFRKSQASPGGRLSELVAARAFTTHTYGHDTLGTEGDIAAMPSSHAYAEAFFARLYRPENATVIVAGDVQPESVFAMIREAYATWEPGSEARPEVPEEPRQTELRRVSLAWPTPTAARLVLAWKMPAEDPETKDVETLQLVSDMLGARIGPLEQALVREEGLAYSVDVSRLDLVDPSLLQVSVILKSPEHVARAETLVRGTVAALRTEVDGEMLESVRSHEKYSFLTGLEAPSRVADVVGWFHRRGGPEAIDRFYRAYDSVTEEDVMRVSETYLIDDVLTIGVLLPVSEDPPAGLGEE